MIAFRMGLRFLALLVAFVGTVHGHGRLLDPPSRASMWRYGFDNPPNWTDNELNCGGFGTQHNVNGGKCGVCGDPWNSPQPRKHEAGGLYGNGIIVKTYQAGQTIDVLIDLNANHGGWFEFKVCPTNDKKVIATQECLDRNVLQLADGTGTKYNVAAFQPGKYQIKLKLPQGLTCSQCVLQWDWVCGNNWGTCPNGKQGKGCGPQETFRGCADVTIV